MTWFPESQDRLPLTWWGQRPIYLSAMIAIGVGVSMILTAVGLAAFGTHLINAGIFTASSVVQHLRVWTLLTYVLINPPDIWLLLTAFLIWRFGESLERHLGRLVFVKLLFLLVLVQPVLLIVLGFAGAGDRPLVGVSGVSFGLFLAFAALYPTAQISLIIVTLEAWMLAAAYVVVAALAALAGRDWTGLLLLAVEVATAVGYIRYETGSWTPSFRLWRKTKPQAAPRNIARTSKKTRSAESSTSSSEIPTREVIDAILDKISRTGITSLTADEKHKLEQASKR